MHDLEFNKLFPVRPWHTQAQANYMSVACEKSAEWYQSNVRRVHALALVPGHIFMDGEEWGIAYTKAMAELGISDKNDNRVVRRGAEIINEVWRVRTLRESKAQFLDANLSIQNLYATQRTLHSGLHALFQVLLIQSWTAFEALYEDLYRNASEAGSSQFAIPTEAEKKDKKLGFLSRRSARNIYKFSFTCDSAAILAPFKSKHITALAELRNLIVHKAAIIDPHFMNATNGLTALSEVRKAGINKPLQLTGTAVRNLIDNAIPLGYDLLSAVDRWLSAHP